MFDTRLFRHFFGATALLAAMILPIAAQQIDADTLSSDTTVPDSIEAWKKQNRARAAWEHLVSFPGTVVVFPLNLLFEGTEQTIVFVHERKLATRIAGWFTYADGRIGIRPAYSSRSGGGLKYFHKTLAGIDSRLNIGASAWMKWRQRYYLSLQRVTIMGGRMTLGLLADYNKFPDEDFFGVGMSSNEEEESDYTHERSGLRLSLGPGIGPNTFIDLFGGLEINSIFPEPESGDPPIGERGVSGIESNVRLGYSGIALEHLAQDHPGRPSGGTNFKFGFSTYRQLNGGKTYGFNIISGRVEHIFHLFYGRTLALRLAGQTVSRQDGKETPFYYLSEIGEDGTVRGFSRGRFRDRDVILGSAEYRYPLRLRSTNGLDALLFVDGGQVSPDMASAFRWEDTEISFGLGLRLWNAKGLITQFAAAISSERLRLHFQLN